MARKNGRQHSPDEAGRLEKIWNLSLPLKRKTTSSVTYATANPSSELAVFSCKHKCYRIVNGEENRKLSFPLIENMKLSNTAAILIRNIPDDVEIIDN